MATTLPTPAGPDPGQPTGLPRRSSLRSGLRRNTSRSQLSRVESNPAPAAYAFRSQSRSQSHAQAPGDSSDDELPVPMGLSALTKALLSDGGENEKENSRVRTRAQSHRPSSPVSQSELQKPVKRRSVLGAAAASIGEEKRQTRASSAQPPARQPSPAQSQASKEASPVRKRVVRLSTASQGSAVSAASQFQPTKRRSVSTSISASTSLSASQTRTRPPSMDGSVGEKGNISEIREKDINTPNQQGRVVKISIGSSSNRGRSTGSSAVSSKRGDSVPRVVDDDLPDEPQTAARSQPEANLGSISRPGSNSSRARNDENQALQSAVRVKRVGKIPGSFLSGPARRGRRRQSEEDAENEGRLLASSQDPEGPQAHDFIDMEPVDNLASSYYVPDRIASGSPVSSKSSARAGLYRTSPSGENEQELVSRQKSPDLDEIIIPHYRIPPPRADIPSRHDQENEAPPTFKREKPAASLLLEKDFPKPVARPINIDRNAPRHTSPERKALSSLNHNTPRRAVPPPPPKMSILDAATTTAGAATTSQAARRRNYMKINGKCYTRIDCLGRGGSGKVYRVVADNGHMFALKRVSIENADENAVKGYKGEIDLLKKLTKVERVITLFDYELNDEKKVLSLLMEMGELDLYTLLKKRCSPENSSVSAKFDPVFVRYYWQEMLECLAAVHAYDIVHSDLKPANFVLVQGRLKLIDFGISNAIQTEETVNVHREAQVGTPNYMSPESLIDSNAAGSSSRRISTGPTRPKLMKLGKPSDIWSLGCILFQMVYGTPPFGHIANHMARCHAIINWQYDIEFREHGVGGVPVPTSLLRTMKRCLSRDQHLRPTCEELLSPTDPFLYPVETPTGSLPITEELLGRIIQSVVTRCRERMPTEAEVLSVWPQAYWGSVAKAIGQDARSVEGR
ncbi:kinase-like domain-containing protein [Hypoxylon argillaceum]|nr:kinase-like domain-containing protein [Hypoxylon argillaceum]